VGPVFSRGLWGRLGIVGVVFGVGGGLGLFVLVCGGVGGIDDLIGR